MSVSATRFRSTKVWLPLLVDSMSKLAQYFVNGLKRVVAYQCHPIRVIGKRIACNTGGLLVGFWKSAVDNQELAARFNRTFAFGNFDRRVRWRYERCRLVRTPWESVRQVFRHPVPSAYSTARTAPMRCLIIDKVALKGGHLRLTEQRRILIAP